jgi:NADPH:quinone reductase-like Zn-dependent oxidoreductase
MFAIKLARAVGAKVILSSSSDEKLAQVAARYSRPPIQTVNYRTIPDWHEEVLRLTNGVGVDIVVENGGTSSLVKSIKCARRGGIVSQVGYLGKQDPKDLEDLVSVIIDRRVVLR